MDRILEKLFLGNLKGSYMIFFFKFGLGLKQLLFPVVLRLRGIILPPPIMGQSKIVCYKTFIFKHNYKWNSIKFKIESKKIIILVYL